MLLMALPGLLAACGGAEPTGERRVTGTGIPALPATKIPDGKYSAEALRALSIAGGQTEQSGDPRQRAMQCAVALRTILAQLNDFPGMFSSSQKASLTRAQRIYDQRLASAAAKQGVSPQTNRSEFEQNLELGLDDPVPQVQRVAGCLRGLARPAE